MNDSISIDKELVKNFLGAFPTEYINLSRERQRIASQIYRLLSEGNPVSIADLSNSLRMDQKIVKSITDKWSGIYYDDDSRIIGYWGLAIDKMGHRFNVDDKNLYTWCAWDALFIPQIIGKTAAVESRDPVTKEMVKLTVTPTDGITKIEPSQAVISFMIPDTDKVRSDVIKSFCHYVHFFESSVSAEEWISESDKKNEIFILPIDEAYELGLRRNELQLGFILESA